MLLRAGKALLREKQKFLGSSEFAPPINLVSPGVVDPRLVWTRAQAGGAKSTALAADGVTWNEYPADVPRFDGPSRYVLMEGQRGNGIRNPRGESVTNSTALVAPGFLHAAFATTRAHTPATASATRQLADGTWAEVAQNLPRFTGPNQRLLVEGTRTNGIRNSRAEGSTPGVIGSGGAGPTNWVFAAVGGIAWEVVGSGTANGINYVRLKFTGTSASSTAARMSFEPNNVIAAAVGQVWTNTHYVRLVAGSQGAFVWQGELREFVSGASGSSGLTTNVTFTADWQRVSVTRTLADAGTTHQQPTVRYSAAVATYNFTIDIGWPQAEQGDFASTPILPPVGAPAAATRNADAISATLAALGLPATAACTIAMKSLRKTISSGNTQFFVEVDDGTAANRYILAGASGSTSHRVTRTLASVDANSTSIAGPAVETIYTSGLRIDGLGGASGYITTLQSVTGGPTAGLTTMRLGGGTTSVVAYWGEIENMVVTPTVLSDLQFQGFVDNVPAPAAIPPNNWTSSTTSGVTIAYGPQQVVNGLPCVPITVGGIPGSTTSSYIQFDVATTNPTSPGAIWTGSFFFALDATFDNKIDNLNNFECRVVPAGATETAGVIRTTFPTTMTRMAHTKIMAAGTTGVTLRFRYDARAAGASWSFRFFLACPQLEVGAFASTPILPPVGTQAASIRGNDLPSATLASLGIAPSGAGNYKVTTIPTSVDGNQAIFTVENAAGDRFDPLQTAGGDVTMQHFVGGSGSSVGPSGKSEIGIGKTINTLIPGDGTSTTGMTGGTDILMPYNPIFGGLTTFRLGNRYDFAEPLWARIPSVQAAPNLNPPIGLIGGDGKLNPLLTYSRPHTPAGAMSAVESFPGGWSEYAQNTPRRYGGENAENILFEGARTNFITNPRGEGANAPSTWPTGWTASADTTTIIDRDNEGGVEFVEIQFVGTAGTARAFEFDLVTVAQGESILCSHFIRLVNGSLAGVQLQSNLRFMANANGSGATPLNHVEDFTPTDDPLAVQRYWTKAVTPAGALSVIHRIRWSATAVPYDFTLRIGWPQVEKGDFISTPILPQAGNIGTSTRGNDMISATLASLGLPPSGAGEFIMECKARNPPGTALATQCMMSVDDGGSNGIDTEINIFIANIFGRNTLAGISTFGNLVSQPDTENMFRQGINIDGTGKATFTRYPSPSDPVGQSVTAAGAPIAGLTTLRFGVLPNNTMPFWGEVGSAFIKPIPKTTLISPGFLSPLLTPSRPLQADGGIATMIGVDGLTWVEVAPDVPRFTGTAKRLLIEGLRTNSVRNPRGEGIPGSLPTNWSMSAPANGITMSVVGPCSFGGMNGVEVAFTGTANANITMFMNFETATAIEAASGQFWTGSAFYRLGSGTYNGTTGTLRIVERDAAGGGLINHDTAGLALPTAVLQRGFGTSVALGATAGRINHALSFGVLNTVTVNFTIQYFWPQLELGRCVSTPILPPVGVPGASTRAADIFRGPMGTMGIPDNCAHTAAAKVVRNAGTVAAQAIGANVLFFPGDDGQFRYTLRGVSGSTSYSVRRVNGGDLGGTNIVGVAAGIVHRAGMRVDGLGNAWGLVNAGTIQTVAGGPVKGQNIYRVGSSLSNTENYWGEIEMMVVTPAVLSDADFRAFVTGLP